MKRFTKWLLFLLTAVACGLRIYQLCVLTEPDTGFLLQTDWSIVALWLLLPLGAAALLFNGALYHREISDNPLNGPGSVGAGAAAGLLGVAVLVESVLGFFIPAEKFSEPFSLAIFWIGVRLLGVVSAAIILLLSVKLFKKETPRIFSAFSLIPALWMTLRALLTFLDARAVITVPSLLMQVISMIVLAALLIAHARLHSGVDSGKGQRMLLYFAPVALFVVTATVVPAAVSFLVRGAAVSPISFEVVTLAAFLPYIWEVTELIFHAPPAPPEKDDEDLFPRSLYPQDL